MSIREDSLQMAKQTESTQIFHMGAVSNVCKTILTPKGKDIPSTILTYGQVNDFILSSVRESCTPGSKWEGA